MPMTKKWIPFSDELGEELNDARAWCIAGDFTNLTAFDPSRYTCEYEAPAAAFVETSTDNVTVAGPFSPNAPAKCKPTAYDLQVLHRVCGIVDFIMSTVQAMDPSVVPMKVLFADKESLNAFRDCSAIHDRAFTLCSFDCANDASYVITEAFHALVAFCINNPLPLSAAARAAASTPTSSTPNTSIAGANFVSSSSGSQQGFVCPYSVSQAEDAATDSQKNELCHCGEGVPASLTEPIRLFIESVANGTWPKARQGQAPPKCYKPCDKLGLTAALKSVESTYVPLVYEPLCDVATIVYSTRCPCCPDVTYMVDRVVNMINRNRVRKAGEPEWEPMWSDMHSPCVSVSASAAISSASHPDSPTTITAAGKRPSFNEYTFEENTEGHSGSIPLSSSSIGSRPPLCPCDGPCLEGGMVSTRMRIVLCNIDENDLSSEDWPIDPNDQIVPHIRFYPATDLSEYANRRPISRIRPSPLLVIPGAPVVAPLPPTTAMGSREYYQFLLASDAARAACVDGGVCVSNGKSRLDPHSTQPVTAAYYHGKKNFIFGLKCEDRSAENVAKFFLSHATRTIVSENGTARILEECRVMDAPKKRSRSDTNMMVLSPSGNALEEFGR